MGATPVHALPYPEETDVPDVPADMQELALALDGKIVARQVTNAKGDLLAAPSADQLDRLPVGADGQVLTADAASTLGVKWAAAAGSGGGILATIIDAKGDLIAGSAPDTPARVAVGADGQVLTADAASAAGVKWATPAAGGSGIPPTLLDAKGDLIAASANDTPARLPVGVNGYALVSDSAQTLGMRWADLGAMGYLGGAIIDAKGDLIAGFANDDARRLALGTDGQVLTVDTAQALGLKWATPASGGGGSAVSIGTTLPSSPSNLQEAILVDSLTAPTYSWRFIYDTSITDANKWIFTGGSPIEVSIEAADTTASATPVDLSAVGPSITIPRSGLYILAGGAAIANSTNGSGGLVAIKRGAAALSVNDMVAQFQVSAASQLNVIFGPFSREFPASQLTGGDVYKLQYQIIGAAGTASFSRRWLRLWPMRVA